MSDEKPRETDPLIKTMAKASPHSSGEMGAVRIPTTEDKPAEEKPVPVAVVSLPEQADLQEQQIQAWTLLSEHLVATIRIIQSQEKKMTTMVIINVIATCVVVVAVLVAGYQWRIVEKNMADQQKTLTELDDTAKKTLRAVSVSLRALSVKIEADTSMTPEIEGRARKTAIEAQRAALEAEKSMASPAEMLKVERELKVVEKKEALEDAGEQ